MELCEFPYLKLPQPQGYEIVTVGDANQVYFTPFVWCFRGVEFTATLCEHQALCRLHIAYCYARQRNEAAIAVARQTADEVPFALQQMAREFVLLNDAYFAELEASRLPPNVQTHHLDDFAVQQSLRQARLYQVAIEAYEKTRAALQSRTLLSFCADALRRCRQQYTVAYIFAVADFSYESARETLDMVASADRDACLRFLQSVREQCE